MTRGRPGTGVEPLHNSIRVGYTVRGQRHRETLHLPPKAENVRNAERIMQRVHREIALGTFSRQAFVKLTKGTMLSKLAPNCRGIG